MELQRIRCLSFGEPPESTPTLKPNTQGGRLLEARSPLRSSFGEGWQREPQYRGMAKSLPVQVTGCVQRNVSV